MRATAGGNGGPAPRLEPDRPFRPLGVAPQGLAEGLGENDLRSGLVVELGRLVRSLMCTRSDDGGAVLLEFEVDGVRCQVVTVERPPDPSGVSLSPREREIVRMVAQGCTNRMIASVLDISEWTVGTHLRRVFTKLEVNSRAAMVARLLGEEGRRHVST